MTSKPKGNTITVVPVLAKCYGRLLQVAAAQREAAAGFRDVAAVLEKQQAAADEAAAGMRQDVRNLHLELVRQFHVQQVITSRLPAILLALSNCTAQLLWQPSSMAQLLVCTWHRSSLHAAHGLSPHYDASQHALTPSNAAVAGG